MTASDKVRQLLVFRATGEQPETAEAIAEAWDRIDANEDLSDALQDAEGELRPGEYRTGLPCDSSRHYESRAVAAQMLDGSWVGWTYWYGGGKHGEPGAVPWIEDAYAVTMTEVVEVVKKFARGDA